MARLRLALPLIVGLALVLPLVVWSLSPAVAETAVAETAVAETAVAETAVAETAVAETAVAETAVAETAVAEITAQPNAENKVEDEYELQKALVDTLDQVERNYVRGISRRELVEAAIDGILRKLDPYSSYIGPKELDEFRGSVESEFGGIGIQITMDGGQLKVLSPLVGTPAYRAGVLAGDRIVEIDGKKTEGLGMDGVVKQLKGEIGSNVVLTVIHPARINKTRSRSSGRRFISKPCWATIGSPTIRGTSCSIRTSGSGTFASPPSAAIRPTNCGRLSSRSKKRN